MNKLSLKVKAKQLSDLVCALGECEVDVKVCGIKDDTRDLLHGEVFVCLPRANNLQKLVADAQVKGASAIVFVGHQPVETQIACVYLPDMDAAGKMLRRWFETESVTMPCIGITGTDGKTSTAWMLREILEKQLGSAWSCGTLGLVKNIDDMMDLGNTTPSLLNLHLLLAMADKAKVKALVLEVSSHGIAQERIAGIPFTAAIWTTIGRDHLEDHGGFLAYLQCKAGFVKSVASMGGVVVANADYALIKQTLAHIDAQVFWYAQCSSADLQWSHSQQQISLTDRHSEAVLQAMPIADFHAENLAAIALLMIQCFEMKLSQFSSFDGHVSTPVGRLEPVDKNQQVFIDYAHTAEGLSRCLQSAKDLTHDQLLLVFGCGGDRDKTKRPQMGAVASKYADVCWLTADNPRSEKQSKIAEDVFRGMDVKKSKVNICDDRGIAISQAVSALQSGDILVIAGKGHESYMEIMGERLPWSDKATALLAIQACEVRACA